VVASTAEEQRFGKLSVIDHRWQAGMIGPAEHTPVALPGSRVVPAVSEL
jgi:hypothetical protein